MRRWLFGILFFVLVGCGDAQVGTPCEDVDDCQQIEGGYCAITGVCAAECTTVGEPCAGTGLCVLAYGRQVCLRSCAEATDCRDVDECREVLGGRACVLADPFGEP